MKIYITYKETCISSEKNFNSKDWSGKNETVLDWQLVGAHLEKPVNPYHEDFEIKDGVKKVYVVYGLYKDRDTFSCTDGRGKILAVFGEFEPAKALADQLKADVKFRNDNRYSSEKIEYKFSDVAVPWMGWGCSLNGLYVKQMPVTDVLAEDIYEA